MALEKVRRTASLTCARHGQNFSEAEYMKILYRNHMDTSSHWDSDSVSSRVEMRFRVMACRPTLELPGSRNAAETHATEPFAWDLWGQMPLSRRTVSMCSGVLL